MSRAERIGGLAFFVSAASAIALIVAYVQDASPQVDGALLGVSVFAFGVAFVVIAHGLLPPGPSIEMRTPFGADEVEAGEVEESFDRIDVVSRRKFLVASAGSAVVALVAVAIVPFRSLGPRPGNALATTPWHAGRRVVNGAGQPVKASDVALNGLVTVFPQGAVSAADGQAVLMRVDPGTLQLPAGRETWTPEGLIAYSKVCTHAGCPVGLFEAERHELLCPCHQSAFDVLTGAKPTSGPAARELPQLPLSIAPDGTLVATGDFSAPVGPSYWEMPR